jgi:hypothetical protein
MVQWLLQSWFDLLVESPVSFSLNDDCMIVKKIETEIENEEDKFDRTTTVFYYAG